MVVRKVTVALLVNVCVDIIDVVGRVVDEDQWLSWSMCVWILLMWSEELWMKISSPVVVLIRIVDRDLMVVCVDVVDVVGRVVDGDLMVSGCVDVVDITGRVADEALGGGYESGKRDGGDSGSSDSNGGGN
ncbi:hypothetical protein YC2023_079894 [Brassica napus]